MVEAAEREEQRAVFTGERGAAVERDVVGAVAERGDGSGVRAAVTVGVDDALVDGDADGDEEGEGEGEGDAPGVGVELSCCVSCKSFRYC